MKKFIFLFVLGLLSLPFLFLAKPTHAATGAIYALSWRELEGGTVYYNGKTYEYSGNFAIGSLMGVQVMNFTKGVYNAKVFQKIGNKWIPVDEALGCSKTFEFTSNVNLKNIPLCFVPEIWKGGVFKATFGSKYDNFRVP